jgi:hypothetical protein
MRFQSSKSNARALFMISARKHAIAWLLISTWTDGASGKAANNHFAVESFGLV